MVFVVPELYSIPPVFARTLGGSLVQFIGLIVLSKLLGNLLEGAVLRDIVMADEVGTAGQGLPPLTHAAGSRIHAVQISNSNIDSTLLTSGDPMMGLEVWSNRDGARIGHARGYTLHMPSGVVDTRAKLPPAG